MVSFINISCVTCTPDLAHTILLVGCLPRKSSRLGIPKDVRKERGSQKGLCERKHQSQANRFEWYLGPHRFLLRI